MKSAGVGRAVGDGVAAIDREPGRDLVGQAAGGIEVHEIVRAAEVAAQLIAEIDGRDIQAAGRRQRQLRREPPGVGR